MLNPRARAILAVYVAVSVVQVVAQATGPDWLAGLTQVLLMPVLVVALMAQTASPRSRLVVLTLGALAGSWLGDTAPRFLDGDPAFLAMVGFFLVAQVCYIAAFRPYAADSILRRDRGWLAAWCSPSSSSACRERACWRRRCWSTACAWAPWRCLPPGSTGWRGWAARSSWCPMG